MITSETWNKDLSDTIRGAGDTVSLLQLGATLWKYRYFKDALKYAIPQFRGKLLSLGGVKEPVVVVDFNNVAHAAWHAKRDVRDTMVEIHKNTSPGSFVVASDSFRKPSSKEPPPDEFYKKNELFKKTATQRGTKWLEVEGREADDILASIAFTCQIAGLECILVTNDQDLYQALGPKTAIYDRKVFKNAESVTASTGLTPKQWPDFLTLSEECDGIGKEGAMKLLRAYGDVDGIHKNAHLLKDGQRKSILNFWPRYLEARRKHFIERDIPVAF